MPRQWAMGRLASFDKSVLWWADTGGASGTQQRATTLSSMLRLTFRISGTVLNDNSASAAGVNGQCMAHWSL